MNDFFEWLLVQMKFIWDSMVVSPLFKYVVALGILKMVISIYQLYSSKKDN